MDGNRNPTRAERALGFQPADFSPLRRTTLLPVAIHAFGALLEIVKGVLQKLTHAAVRGDRC